MKCLSRMTGNCHVRFLGGKAVVTPLTQPIVRMEEIRRRTRRLRQRRAHRINCTLSAVCLFLTVGIASLLYQEHVPGLSIVLAGYGSVLLHSGADAYIVVSVGSFVTGVVFTLLGIRYRQYKTLHRPFSPDAVDKASSQSLSDDQ
jgi:hypothetical protein